jgi:DNA-binding transcriptional regulator YiaG
MLLAKQCDKLYACLNDLLVTNSGKPPHIDYPQPNITLFQNGRNQPFASCLVIWQACMLMNSKKRSSWQQQGDYCFYEYQGRSGKLVYFLPLHSMNNNNIDIRLALIHLLLAACVTQKKRPWEEEIIINDRIIIDFLGLNQRKDMTRLNKLLLIHTLMEEACRLEVEVNWQQRGKIEAIQIPCHPLWSVHVRYYITNSQNGLYHLAGLSFGIRAGSWASYFLNQEKAKTKTAYYQYSWLPISLPPKIMNLWQRHEGAGVMLLHLLFRLRVGNNGGEKVATLLKTMYGEEALQIAWYKSEERRKTISAFESDLEQLYYYGVKLVFDDTTYPESIYPDWMLAQSVPDDPEEALHYWTENARHTKPSMNSKQKWMQLLNASIAAFVFPPDWQIEISKNKVKRRQYKKSSSTPNITGDRIKEARMKHGMSQRYLSSLLNKSQSWIRDIESGRYKLKQKDIDLLTSILGQDLI